MKINEKIQYYRKKAGLSQEELGKRLLVSRQTVSLWETGQTLPTLDNLTRLREIFGVSIDELLLEDEEQVCSFSDEKSIGSYESYNFKYSEADIKKIHKSVFVPNFVAFCLVFALFVCSVVAVIIMPKPRFDHGIMVCFLFMMSLFTSLISLSSVRDSRTTRKERLKTEYTLHVFGNRFVLEKRIDSILYELRTVFFDRIKTIINGKDFLSVYVGSEIYNFKHGVIALDSVLYSITGRDKSRAKAPKGIREAARISFILSLISVICFPIIAMIAISSSSLVAWIVSGGIILISVASVALGIVLYVHGAGGGKFIVMGMVSLFVVLSISLTLIGSFGYTPIEDAEYYIGIDIPDKHNGMSMNVVEDYFDNAYVYYRAEYYFEDEDVVEFESELTEDSLWLNLSDAEELITLCPESAYYQGAEYFLFYEFTTQLPNYSPDEGEYVSYIFIAYFVDENMLMITEFDYNT